MKERRIPQRSCVGCRSVKDKQELWRIVRGSDGKVCFDPKGKLAGRGAYLCQNPECLEKAIRTRALERSLSVTIDQETYQALQGALANE